MKNLENLSTWQAVVVLSVDGLIAGIGIAFLAVVAPILMTAGLLFAENWLDVNFTFVEQVTEETRNEERS